MQHFEKPMEGQGKDPRVRRSQRDYSLPFTLGIVAEVEQGELTHKEAQRKYGIQDRSKVENALAERMNRTIKEEFCMEHGVPTRDLARQAVAEAVSLYNTHRPQLALGGQTPETVRTKKSR
jgi:hypothetical protein